MTDELGVSKVLVKENLSSGQLSRLRDEYAMAALTGMLAAYTPEQMRADVKRGDDPLKLTASAAYAFANAMLSEREKHRASPEHEGEG